jgi:DNA-directed RNA polymerase specialized sigma24 family protein
MAIVSNADSERVRRFRDAALPHLDDVFTFARCLMRDSADAEDAAQECYLRALRHFDSYRGPAMKPWLLAILRNVCNSEFARRGNRETPADPTEEEEQATSPIWQNRNLRLKLPCCASRTATRFAGSSPRCRNSSARPSCCGRSMICLITRLPRSLACRWER